MTLEESMKKQFKLIKISEKEIIEELEKVTEFRPNFDKFVKYCQDTSLMAKVVSAGLDFIIFHFLKKIAEIEIFAARTTFSSDGIDIEFDVFFEKSSTDFKNDIVKHYKQRDFTVYFVGDGSSDYGAVVDADFNFVVKNSKLHKYCLDNQINHLPFEDFNEIVSYLKDKEIN
jgi:2-hydroxy-3-keto-5-methylthiopentenyl-1-phosphate phosphatase